MAANLTAEREFRYIVTWFTEWSDLQKEDFLTIFVDYLKNGSSSSGGINGLCADLSNASCDDNKPMSLFQCRVKLFREWSVKWPDTMKDRLREKIEELDTEFHSKVAEEMKVLQNGNGHAQTPVNGDDKGEVVEEEEKEEEQVAPLVAVPAAAAAVVHPEEAIIEVSG